MSWTGKLRRGRVISAEVPDQRGANPKRRPVVLLHDAANLAEGGELIVAAITSTLPKPLPADHVLLPHSKDPKRKAVTGLSAPSAVVCSWLPRVPIDSLTEATLGGIVPLVYLETILVSSLNVRAVPPARGVRLLAFPKLALLNHAKNGFTLQAALGFAAPAPVQ